MDVKDVTILKGIGEWVAKNKASIYDVGPSSLPLQSWGVTTQKNNLVYLHVFNWPSDGRLQLGGLLNKIDKAYLLTDPAKQPLRIITGNRMTSIMVPPQAPDTSNTVIVLALKEKPKTDSVRFVASNTATRLLAFDAILKGKGFGFGDGKASGYYTHRLDVCDLHPCACVHDHNRRNPVGRPCAPWSPDTKKWKSMSTWKNRK